MLVPLYYVVLCYYFIFVESFHSLVPYMFQIEKKKFDAIFSLLVYNLFH